MTACSVITQDIVDLFGWEARLFGGWSFTPAPPPSVDETFTTNSILWTVFFFYRLDLGGRGEFQILKGEIFPPPNPQGSEKKTWLVNQRLQIWPHKNTSELQQILSAKHEWQRQWSTTQSHLVATLFMTYHHFFETLRAKVIKGQYYRNHSCKWRHKYYDIWI